MPELKVFALGNHGFVASRICDLLGLPEHVRQARVLIVAPSKVQAARLSAARGCGHPSVSDPEFRQATGRDVDALRAAGLLDQPAVFVMAFLVRPGDPVVQVDDGGPQIIGRMTAGVERETVTFAAEDHGPAAEVEHG